MWLAYAIALVPIILGAVFYASSEHVTWWEWAVSGIIGLVLAVVFHGITIQMMTKDVETWSGRVTEVVRYPEWVEEYEEIHTRTIDDGEDSEGNHQSHTETYTTTEYRTHHEYWLRHEDFGRLNSENNIERGEFDDTAQQFGGQVDTEKPHKSGFHSGDPNVYHVRNHTGVVIPLTMTQPFENRIKAAPSVFTFAKVPEGTKVFDWPTNPNPKVSDRVMGIARNRFSTLKWDQMCAKLGPTARVNLIVVGFDSDDSALGQWQQAKWIGGKKNDLVVCYGCADRSSKPKWVYCFGWTEREDVKKNLQTLFLTSELSDELLPKIEAEVSGHYRLKDWTKFDYITVQPPFWAFGVLIGVMMVAQVVAWLVAFNNSEDKDWNSFARRRFAYRKGLRL